MEIKGRNIIITGAASGLGKELTKQMLSLGGNVAAIDINEANLKQLKEELKTDKLKTYIVDAGNKESIAKFRKDYIKGVLIIIIKRF